ncbi:MAG: hypothetical protein ACR2LA_10210 [Acidimicrobiales bacterium]
MGIDHDGVAFLEAASRMGVDFGRTCTIGRQRLTVGTAVRDANQTAETFFAGLGAEPVELSY